MQPGWDASLEALGRRGDVIQALATRFRETSPGRNLRVFSPGPHTSERLIGTASACAGLRAEDPRRS